MNILAFSSYYLPGFKGGGPIKTVKNLSENSGDEIIFNIITGDRDLGDSVPYNNICFRTWNSVGGASVFYLRPGFKGYWEIFQILLNKNYDLVYLNSFFSIRFSFFPLLIAKILRQGIVLGPRGEFSAGALDLKKGKKWAFITVYKLCRLHRGVVFQASSNFEAEDIRRVLGQKVDIKVAEDIGAQEFADDVHARNVGPLKAVFVSRISPKKNLLTALRMLRSVRQPICYHIYGPIEDLEYWRHCEEVMASLPMHVHVEYQGTLTPDQVVKSLSDYDVFFFPTKGENYGHVIAEALCAGLPILISDTTPWKDLQREGIGWDLPLKNPIAFSSVLDQLATMPVSEHLRMRRTILYWAKKKFFQRDAVDANIEMFRYAYEKK